MMVEYARKECADCHGMFAANQMEAISERSLSGTSESSKGQSVTKHYRYTDKLICRVCASRRFRGKVAAFIFLLIIAAVVVFALMIKKQMDNHPAEAIPTNILAGADDPNALPTAPPMTASDDTAARDIAPASSSDNIPASSDNPPPAAKTDDRTSSAPPEQATPDDRDEMDAAILKATPKALDSGQPERWKASGKSGYIVVSTPQAYADRVCRNVYATIIDGSSQTQSSSHKWCEPTAGGDWAAQ